MMRDVVAQVGQNAILSCVTVFVLEAVLLVVSLGMLARIDAQHFQQQSRLSLAERAALLHGTSS